MHDTIAFRKASTAPPPGARVGRARRSPHILRGMTSAPSGTDERAPRPDSAVVFVHGIVGFHRLRWIWPPFRYFRGLPSALSRRTVATYFPELPSGRPVIERGALLADFIDRLPEGQLHVIAHSMGGLDARYAIARYDRNRRVRALTTVATPHRGTPLVEWARTSKGAAPWVVRRLSLPGLLDLSPEACARFNDAVPDRPDVTYRSYAGVRPLQEIPWLLRSPAAALSEAGLEHDSQVPLSSARWGDFRGVIRADHWELVGWSVGPPHRKTRRPLDHIAFYLSLMDEILGRSSETA